MKRERDAEICEMARTGATLREIVLKPICRMSGCAKFSRRMVCLGDLVAIVADERVRN
jgi:hypothetical protein